MSAQATRTAPHRPRSSILLRGRTVIGLLVDAIVHLHPASSYQEASPGGRLHSLSACSIRSRQCGPMNC